MSDEDDVPFQEHDEDGAPSAVDPESYRKAQERQRQEAEERAKFWHDVFSTEVGRREMWRLLARLHPFDTNMATTPVGFPDERATWMHLATQLEGQHLFQTWFGEHPELVLAMRQENDKNFRKSKG